LLSIRVTVIEANRSRSKPDRGIIRPDFQVLNQHQDVNTTVKTLIFLSAGKQPERTDRILRSLETYAHCQPHCDNY
jgi:hypothetical protein